MTDKQQNLIKSVEDIPEDTAVEVVEKEVVAMPVDRELSATDQLIRYALESDVDMDKLKTLIELKNSEADRSAALAFDKKFSAMQKQLPVIKKGKQVKDDNGKVMYAYAPLEAMQRDCDPIIGKFGFSYRWREESTEQGKRVTIRISGHGHFEESTFDVPQVAANKWSNAVQAMGSMTTFGHRYTYVAGFGITVEGVDDDAAFGFEEGVKYADYVHAMDQETDLVTLHATLTEIAADLRERGDSAGIKFLTRYYTQLKKEMA